MKKIILICGLPATGKSTSSRLLYRQLERAGLIEADALTNVQAFINDEELSPLKIKNGADIICNFIEAGCTDVIASGLLDNQQELEWLISALSMDDVIFFIFELTSDFETRDKRWKKMIDPADPPRPLAEVDRKLSKSNFKVMPSVRVYKIDTSDEDPEEIATEMISILNEINT